jgi:hypothetical protein
MVLARRNYDIDSGLVLDDGGSAHTAAGWSTVAGQQVALDLGAGYLQGITIALPAIANSSTLTLQQPRIDLVAVIYISAITISGSDIYRLSMVGSNNIGFASSNFVLGQLQFGVGSAMDPPFAANSHAPAGSGNYPAGDMYELMFTNEVQSTPLEYISMYVSGTFGSITFTSFISVLPRS